MGWPFARIKGRLATIHRCLIHNIVRHFSRCRAHLDTTRRQWMNALNRTLLLLLVMALTALSACDNAKTAGDPAPSAASAGADKKAAEKLDEEEKDDDDDDE